MAYLSPKLLFLSMSEDSSNTGCAALINLVVSVIILLILVGFLLPGYFDLPDWFSNFIDLSRIEKPVAWGNVNSFPQTPQNSKYVYLLNTSPEKKLQTTEEGEVQAQHYEVLAFM